MREIKFRAWVNDILCDVIEISTKYIGVSICDSGPFQFLRDGVILEQYTGLEDKNGKEIYEGDVLLGGNYQGSIALGIVTFEDGAFICKPIGRFMEGLEEGYRFNNFEIKGNIHENPELLED